MYPEIHDAALRNEIMRHEEFAELQQQSARADFAFNPSHLDNVIANSQRLRLRNYQEFVRRFLAPHSTYTRCLLKFSTGTGKTPTALSIAHDYMQYYSEIWNTSGTAPSVLVIGFSRQVFLRELFKRPEYGFITHEDIEREQHLRFVAENGTASDANALQEFYTALTRRIQNRRRNGFFRFYGYKEFANQLVIPTHEITRAEITTMSEQEIIAALRARKLRVNSALLESLQNSLVICDEIHNTYNSERINNYGKALRLFSRICSDVELAREIGVALQESRMRMLLLSATPLINLPSEIVDLMNILLPVPQIRAHVQRDELHTDDILKNESVHAAGQTLLRKLLSGHVMYLDDTNPAVFPSYSFSGSEIKLSREQQQRLNMKYIKYLKFQRTELAPKHAQHYDIEDVMPASAHSLLDMVFPGGAYKTAEVNKIAPGNWLKSIAEYSGKYARMLQLLQDNLASGTGKAIINHSYIRGSGVIIIAEILRANGFVEYGDEPREDSLCATCGLTLKLHRETRGVERIQHKFITAKYVLVHGELDRGVINRRISTFNSRNNLRGEIIKVLVGSSIINEGYDFAAIREIYVAGLLNNIPTLIQLIGRGIRQRSHADLPSSERSVKIHILTVRNGYEERRYAEKMRDYIEIQQLERIMHETAVDALVNSEIIKPQQANSLRRLRYDVPDEKIVPDRHASKQYWYTQRAIAQIMYIVKRLFIEQSTCWKYNDLWRAVRAPPFALEYTTQYLHEQHFRYVLSLLMQNSDDRENLLDNIFSLQPFIMINRLACKLVVAGKFIYALPLVHLRINAALGQQIISQPILDAENWNRHRNAHNYTEIDITDKLNSSTIGLNKIKLTFYRRYAHRDLTDFPVNLNEFGIDFHIYLAQQCVAYCFEILTNANARYSELHDFYIKMLMYYDRMDLIVYASMVDGFTEYTASPSKNGVYGIVDVSEHIGAFINTSAQKTSITRFEIENFNRVFNLSSKPLPEQISLANMNIAYTDDREITRVAENLLPVGHFITDKMHATASVIDPKTREFIDNVAINVPEYTETENNVIVGFYEQNNASISLKFKLRQPVQKIVQQSDTRRIRRGVVCETHNKKDITQIAKSLGINTKRSMILTCNAIKNELMQREANERRAARRAQMRNTAYKKIRWFYMHFERQKNL